MPVEHARLQWDEQGQPLSSSFDDVYFSKASGLEESRYVFLQHNRLSGRFATLQDGDCFVVGETGFGTGLNFLCTWQLFRQQAASGARLHFISVEKFPLQPGDLQRALAIWPELQELSRELLQAYLVIQPGMQTLTLDQGRIQLTLLIGEASEQLAQLDVQVNAWFLDGFAPAKNPEMWTESLFAQLARLSAPDATLATFTSAGFVRRGLMAAGFAMQRSKGFGHKREMLCGQLEQMPAPEWQPPWFARPTTADAPSASAHLAGQNKQAIVVGAGLAGCATAWSLARRGWQITLLERESDIARCASGNAQGMLYLKLSAAHTALSQLVLAGFGYSRRLLQQWSNSPHWQACGLLQLAWNPQEERRQEQLAGAFDRSLLYPVNAEQASQIAGANLPHGGLFYPDSGWVSPADWCRWFLRHPLIKVETGCEVGSLQQLEHGWLLESTQGRHFQAPVVVLAHAADALQLPQGSHLPLKSIRGQTSLLPATPASSALTCVVSADGYVSPANNGQHCLGASFVFAETGPELTRQEQRDNIERLHQLSPALYQAMGGDVLAKSPLEGHAALRCSTPDYLPVIGPLVDADTLRSTYARLGKDARWQATAPCPWLPGLYANLAHGSRGLITAPLAGEVLAAMVCNEPQPLPRSVLDACHPNRFLIRQLIRH